MNTIFLIVIFIFVFIMIYLTYTNDINNNTIISSTYFDNNDHSHIDEINFNLPIKKLDIFAIDKNNVNDIVTNINTLDFDNNNPINKQMSNNNLIKNDPMDETVLNNNLMDNNSTNNILMNNDPIDENILNNNLTNDNPMAIDDKLNKKCFVINLENAENYNIIKEQLSRIIGDFDLEIRTNYIPNYDDKYAVYIVYINTLQSEIIREKYNVINKKNQMKIEKLENIDKIYKNNMTYEKYNSEGLIKTNLLLIIGMIYDEKYDENINNSIDKMKMIKINNKNYYILNVEGLKWDYIIKIINKLSIYSNIYQLSFYLA